MAGHDCSNNADDDGNGDLVCGQGRKILGTWNQSELDCGASRKRENDVSLNESEIHSDFVIQIPSTPLFVDHYHMIALQKRWNGP